jgi:hypothetical protein
MGVRGAYGNGADRFEPTRTGPLESVARGKAEAFDAGRSGRAAESKRPPGAADAAPPSRARRSLPGAWTARPSNRKFSARLEQKILARLGQRYADFGPPLAEHLAQEGFSVSRETLRKWMTQAALWRPRRQRVQAVHVWRERRACFGELVMQDSSPFRWLEDRGPACQLSALLDDASSRMWGAVHRARHYGREPANSSRLVAALWTSLGPLHR